MTTDSRDVRHPLLVQGAATRDERSAVLAAALEVLEPQLDAVWMDEPAETSVPTGWRDDLALLRFLAEAQVKEGRLPRTDEPHLGVDLDDLRDPRQRTMFARLATLTTAEAYTAAEDLLVATSEEGGVVRLELTASERDALDSLLRARGAQVHLEPAEER